MENGGRFHRYPKHAKQPSTSATSSGKNSVQANNSSSANSTNLHYTLSQIKTSASNSTAVEAEASQQQKQAAECSVREQDRYMPIANVIRIMRRILPPHAKISDDAKETIQECVSEYISFITSEANERCQQEQRKTITAEDVLWAMEKLGFDDYVEPLNLFLSRYRDMENERNNLRDPFPKRSNEEAVDYGNLEMPTFVPSYPMFPPPQCIYDGGMLGGAYYRDVSAAAADFGGSSAPHPNPYLHFDPFAEFK